MIVYPKRDKFIFGNISWNHFKKNKKSNYENSNSNNNINNNSNNGDNDDGARARARGRNDQKKFDSSTTKIKHSQSSAKKENHPRWIWIAD